MDYCVELADTGGPVLSLLAAGVAALALGVALVVLVRRRRSRVAAGLALLLVCVAVSTGLAANASAEPYCPPQNQLTITQTSVLTGLAPGAPPAPITGVIHNRGDRSPVITAVTVSISNVEKAAGAAAGPCDASDYTLIAPRMPLGRALAPDESAPFSGASIGFNNKSVNQDACQGARVDLRYTSS